MRDKIERTLVIVDLENIAGGSLNVGRESERIRKMVIGEINDNHEYLIVVATGKQAVKVSPEVLWHWSDARFLIGVGIDGADKRLLNVLEDEPVGVSTGSIHIWSGDHCFAPITRKLRKFGCDVRIFSEERSLSRELKSAASAVQTFKGPFITADDVFVSREVQVA